MEAGERGTVLAMRTVQSIFLGNRLFFCAERFVKPILQALLLADHVYQDKHTGKKVVAGIFHRLGFISKDTLENKVQREIIGKDGTVKKMMPGGLHAGSPYAYVSLTEIHGEQSFDLRYVDLDEDRGIFEAQYQVNSVDPLAVIDFIVPLPPLPANKAGTFALELLWQGDLLGMFRVMVEEVKFGEQ